MFCFSAVTKGTEMDSLQEVVAELNGLLQQNSPATFNSTWIVEHAPKCYSIIRKHLRSEVGGIDWDRITRALESGVQRLWAPQRKRNSRPYRNRKEIDLILNKYRSKLYVFVAPADTTDLQIRDTIAIALVRVSQAGNVLARAEVIDLLRYTIDGWLENYCYMSRWRGHEDEIEKQVNGCISRYRYSGSFIRYLFRTLEYAGRGIRSLRGCSLDDPIGHEADGRKIDLVIRDPETNEIGFYQLGKGQRFDADPQSHGWSAVL
jgi:hypothetical protein